MISFIKIYIKKTLEAFGGRVTSRSDHKASSDDNMFVRS